MVTGPWQTWEKILLANLNISQCMGTSPHISGFSLEFCNLVNLYCRKSFWSLVTMEFKGLRIDGLYKAAEKDVIDDWKDEVEYLKKKIKHWKYRGGDLEDELN